MAGLHRRTGRRRRAVGPSRRAADGQHQGNPSETLHDAEANANVGGGRAIAEQVGIGMAAPASDRSVARETTKGKVEADGLRSRSVFTGGAFFLGFAIDL